MRTDDIITHVDIGIPQKVYNINKDHYNLSIDVDDDRACITHKTGLSVSVLASLNDVVASLNEDDSAVEYYLNTVHSENAGSFTVRVELSGQNNLGHLVRLTIMPDGIVKPIIKSFHSLHFHNLLSKALEEEKSSYMMKEMRSAKKRSSIW